MFTVKPHYVNLFLAFLTILCFAWLHKTAQRPEMSSASAFWLHSLSSSCWKQQAFKTNILKRKACHDGFWSLMVLRESWWLVFIFLSLFRLTVVNKHGTLQNTLIELLVVKRSAGVTLLSWLTLRHQPDCTVSGLGCTGVESEAAGRESYLGICLYEYAGSQRCSVFQKLSQSTAAGTVRTREALGALRTVTERPAFVIPMQLLRKPSEIFTVWSLSYLGSFQPSISSLLLFQDKKISIRKLYILDTKKPFFSTYF